MKKSLLIAFMFTMGFAFSNASEKNLVPRESYVSTRLRDKKNCLALSDICAMYKAAQNDSLCEYRFVVQEGDFKLEKETPWQNLNEYGFKGSPDQMEKNGKALLRLIYPIDCPSSQLDALNHVQETLTDKAKEAFAKDFDKRRSELTNRTQLEYNRIQSARNRE